MQWGGWETSAHSRLGRRYREGGAVTISCRGVRREEEGGRKDEDEEEERDLDKI